MNEAKELTTCDNANYRIVIGEVFGDTHEGIDARERSLAVDGMIIENLRRGRKADVQLALALHYVKSTKAYKHCGYESWKDYADMLSQQYEAFASLRQADRYVHAVETFIIQYPQGVDVLLEYGPSKLGVIAESGIVQSAEDAAHWLHTLCTLPTLRAVVQEVNKVKMLTKPTPATP